jgi:hypothetical protein
MKYLSNHSWTIGAALMLAMFAAAVPAHAVERNRIIVLSPGQLQNLDSKAPLPAADIRNRQNLLIGRKECRDRSPGTVIRLPWLRACA